MLLLTHAYLENIGPEGGIGELEDVVGSDEVKSRLVLVHRVQDGLQREERGLLYPRFHE